MQYPYMFTVFNEKSFKSVLRIARPLSLIKFETRLFLFFVDRSHVYMVQLDKVSCTICKAIMGCRCCNGLNVKVGREHCYIRSFLLILNDNLFI
jgi:hypothetical protein